MKRALPLLLLVAAVGVGCGAAGKNTNTGGVTGTRGELFSEENTAKGQSAAFNAGKTYCNLYPLQELARQEGVKATPEAVARSYSSAEATPKDKKDAYNGCLAALKPK
jgi:hypothetical protein